MGQDRAQVPVGKQIKAACPFKSRPQWGAAY